MEDKEIDELMSEVAQLCLDAIERDLDLGDEAFVPSKLQIHEVDWDSESGTIVIDYDYDVPNDTSK